MGPGLLTPASVEQDSVVSLSTCPLKGLIKTDAWETTGRDAQMTTGRAALGSLPSLYA